MSRMDHVAAAPVLTAMNGASRSAAFDAIEMFLAGEARFDAAGMNDELVGAFMDCVRGYRCIEESHNAAEYLADVSRAYANEVCDRMTE